MNGRFDGWVREDVYLMKDSRSVVFEIWRGRVLVRAVCGSADEAENGRVHNRRLGSTDKGKR
jgi:hypothetical protein